MKNAVLGILPVILLLACSKQEFDTIPETKQTKQEAKWNAKVDFLIMVDNSSSMEKYQNRLAAEVPAMVEALKEAGIDYHFAVITTTMSMAGGGRFVGTPRYLSEDTPNMVALLQSRIRAGQTGADLERGFEAIMKVLHPDYLAGEGAGFLRDDALLSLVLLTNENDYSGLSPKSLIDYLDELKPPITAQHTTYKNWNANHLGVLSLEGSCSSTPEMNEVTEEFIELADYSGGIKASICDTSFSDAVANIQKRLISVMTDFKLNKLPDVSTIRVHNNGVLVPNDPDNGWTYVEDGNLIRFHGTALPGPDANITIDFKPLGGT